MTFPHSGSMRTLLLLVAIGAVLATFGFGLHAARHLRPGVPRWKAFASWTAGNRELYDAEGQRAIAVVNWTSVLAIIAFGVRIFVR